MLLQQKEIYNFLRSVTIKFDPIASYLNNTLLEKGYSVNFEDPTTWKYYKNMVGEYHTSDTLMYVTSLDTREQILFSPSILKDHPRTFNAYKPGGSFYKKICETYPSQVDLIKSILFPVDGIEKCILADNFTLLNYSSGYLEAEEEPKIIEEIEKFLTIFVERWYLDFLSDEIYFYLTAWGSLYTYLAMLIMSTRINLVKTPYVHSWHIWNALKDKGIDDYSDILDRKKAMFLYQNIEYFRANVGKQSNLELLVEGLLNDLSIGIYARKVVQESETGSDNYQLTPQLAAVRVPSSYASLATEIPTETVAVIQEQIYEKGLTPASDAEYVDKVTRRLGDTTYNNFLTKFLEIRPLARNIPYASMMSGFILETLIVSVKNNYYTKAIDVVEPISNTDLYLFPRELIALYYYCIQKSLGIENDLIPTHFELCRSFNTSITTPVKKFNWWGETLLISSQVDVNDYMSGTSYNTDIQSPEEFTSMATNLWLTYLSHVLQDQGTKLERKRSILQYLNSLLHSHKSITLDLVPGFTSYSDWLGPNGLNIQKDILSQYSSQTNILEAWGNFADKIITALIPLNDTLKSFGNFTLSDAGYIRLRELFVQMCSYRVVFLESSRASPEFDLGPKMSTHYGPIDMETYREELVTFVQTTRDTFTTNVESTLHGGFTKDSSIDVESVSYKVYKNTIDLAHNTMTEVYDKPKIMTKSFTSTTFSGSLTLGYQGTNVTVVD
jgi:hypothetical protein